MKKWEIDDLQNYFQLILDLERSAYVQKSTIENLEAEIEKLGKEGDFIPPELETVKELDFFNFIVYLFIYFLVSTVTLAFLLFFSALAGISLEPRTYFVLWLIIGIVLSVYNYNKDNKKLKNKNDTLRSQYYEDLKIYNQELQTDKEQVKKEIDRQMYINSEIKNIKKQQNEINTTLKILYAQNVVDVDYQNVVSIYYLYSYFRKGRCFSLSFDATTGDIGAYNIYENEKRLDKIIENTDTIIRQIDNIIENPEGLNKMTDIINLLTKSVINMSYNMQNMQHTLVNISNNIEIMAYSEECKKKQNNCIDFLNSMAEKYEFVINIVKFISKIM